MKAKQQQIESAHLTWCYYDSWSWVFADNVSWSVRILRHMEVKMQGTLRLRGTKGIRLKRSESPRLILTISCLERPKVSRLCWTFLADTPLQHCVAVWDTTSGLIDRGGGTSFQNGGSGVYVLTIRASLISSLISSGSLAKSITGYWRWELGLSNLGFRRNNEFSILVVDHWTSSVFSTDWMRVHWSLPSPFWLCGFGEDIWHFIFSIPARTVSMNWGRVEPSVMQLGWDSAPPNLRPWLSTRKKEACPLQIGDSFSQGRMDPEKSWRKCPWRGKSGCPWPRKGIKNSLHGYTGRIGISRKRHIGWTWYSLPSVFC